MENKTPLSQEELQNLRWLQDKNLDLNARLGALEFQMQNLILDKQEVIKELEGKQEIKEKIQKMLKLGEPYKFDVNLFDTIAVTQFIKSASLEDYKRFRKFCSAGLRSLTDRELEEIISLYNKKFPVSIPSFYTVKKILEDFEKKGIVQRRKLEGRKAPEVWHLSAPFSRVYFYTVSKLEERLTEKPTAFMKNLYSLITGKRYFYTEED